MARRVDKPSCNPPTRKASEANLAALADSWIDGVHARKPQSVIVLEMDSSVSETNGAQEGSAYEGHYGRNCYQPLFLLN